MEDFTGFRFGRIHSSDLLLKVVTSSNRYVNNLLPNPTDYTVEVPGDDGEYYFGYVYKNKEITVNVAFDSIEEPTWRKMALLFSLDKLLDLVFDENPYKTYKAKLKSKPEFKYICFKDRHTGLRVYKGEGTLNFICYHPLAFCYNKYIVRAADYYKCIPPEKIITTNGSAEINYHPSPLLPGIIKGDHYNIQGNMCLPWKGGYPTIEQVLQGELFFSDAKVDIDRSGYSGDKKMIIDVRGYWNNIPQWQCAAKLLTSPTLDYDQNLIFMPQYSRDNYYNMDIGLNHQNALMGSRLLVYNPGDVPIEFELRLGNLTQTFRLLSGVLKFRISRYNVQRLSVELAVDWILLDTKDRDDDNTFKYGSRYVTIGEMAEGSTALNPKAPHFVLLKTAHPDYLYFAEPIPRKKLGHFIKLFYWLSKQCGAPQEVIDYENAIEYANRYEELYDLCITEDERNELYWRTFYDAILSRYKALNEYAKAHPTVVKPFFSENYTFELFCYDVIHHPPEYIRQNEDLNYDDFIFNITRFPSYYTYDYMEITNENFDTIANPNSKDEHRPETLPLFLDFSKRLLYYVKDPDEITAPDRYKLHYEPSKVLFNDNLVKGKWFKLPPGWSLIDVSPIIDEDIWGGKRWLDARPFDWGYNLSLPGDTEALAIERTEQMRKKVDLYIQLAAIDYVAQASPLVNLKRNITDKDTNPFSSYNALPAAKEIKDEISQWELYLVEDLILFRRWYETDSGYKNYKTLEEMVNFKGTIKGIGYEIWRNKLELVEYGFLRELADYWRIGHANPETGLVDENHDVDEWWWYASNYLWVNFPPLYWGYADLFNKLLIKYIPLYY